MNPQAHYRSRPPGPGGVHFVALGALASFGAARQEARR